MNVIYIMVAAFVGGIVSSLLGWVETQEPFVARKFAASLIRAFIAAGIFAAGFSYANHFTPLDILWAFLGGIGVDAGGHRIAAAIRAGRTPDGG